jgi:tetratricopeptide (TPR) repeat protein
MAWPDWSEDNKWRWIIGTVIAIIAIIIPVVLHLLSRKKKSTQSLNINGNNNIPVQINESPGATVNVNSIDPESLAQQLAKHLPDQQDFAAKEDEIRELKATIERLQKDPADELKQEALQALKEDDTNKATELLEESARSRTEKAAQDWIDIGNIAYLNDTQKAFSSYEKATNLDPSNLDAWNRLGHIQNRLGHLDQAQHAYEKVLELAGKDKESQAIAYGNLGNIYKTRGELDKAEEFHLKSLEINKTLGRQEGIANVYSNLGVIYRTRGELDKAEEFHLKSLEIEKILGRQGGMANQYGNLGIIYETRGNLENDEDFYKKSLEINKKLGTQEGMAVGYGNLGNIYETRGELDKAEEFHLKSLEINKTLGRQEGMASVYGNLGNIYKTRGEFDKACDYWQKSLHLFTSIGVQDKIDLVSQWIAENCK